MVKRCKLRTGGRRPKAFAGEAIVAAGINAAASLAGAGIQALAAKNAAKQQASATERAAASQAESMQRLNEYNNSLQQQSIDFMRQENRMNRDLQKQMQMNLHMLAGRENETQRLEGAKIQLRCGGAIKRKKALNGALLQGGNIPFSVTDGGGVVPIAQTSEGFDLYEIVGNDHNHYHKAQGGKNKTGVGIKVPGFGVVEGEGNQNTSKGELLLVTPDDVQFISKHSLKGFNPREAVMQGMNPSEAFEVQEQIKAMYGIKDNGKKLVGGGIDPTSYITTGTMFNNSFIPTETYGQRSLAKCGKRVKAASGYDINALNRNNLIGAGITSFGNLLGAGISYLGNRAAEKYTTAGNTQAANILSDAYSRLKGINMSSINRNMFSAPHAMANIRSAYVNTNNQTAAIDRATQRQLSAIRKNSLSGAAALNRMNTLETAANDARSTAYAKANETAEAIRQQNAATITSVANANADRDLKSSAAYADNYLKLLQYNADVENSKIVGSAQAQADALTQNAQLRGSLRQASWNNLANSLATGAGAFSTALQTNANNRLGYNMALLNASTSSLIEQAFRTGDRAYLQQMLNTIPADTHNKMLKQYRERITTFLNNNK